MLDTKETVVKSAHPAPVAAMTYNTKHIGCCNLRTTFSAIIVINGRTDISVALRLVLQLKAETLVH
jgi:hypothetical protein